uniref:Uncharacterized protein n=1 Tax=Chromera velia CCMP2878 TaxID=1169474 RepID=A0A0G4HHA4_9ALVE|eukprot:Cvel_27555.t1-p1 / transcript=Cvel_27555.t1 / gene=Cvel_27555 / organism=Chromera_velia_CCMP2878 / gene_product=hypothetical protein / transcript_product=hypothetical protein / location=Cvel_scaffold3461:3033-3266(-) / protein_length=78 / sequence_SO=supercontig / SO=protein_coding / is_pseudo=false
MCPLKASHVIITKEGGLELDDRVEVEVGRDGRGEREKRVLAAVVLKAVSETVLEAVEGGQVKGTWMNADHSFVRLLQT